MQINRVEARLACTCAALAYPPPVPACATDAAGTGAPQVPVRHRCRQDRQAQVRLTGSIPRLGKTSGQMRTPKLLLIALISELVQPKSREKPSMWVQIFLQYSVAYCPPFAL